MATKHLSLAALVIQNSALALVMRQSRAAEGPRYVSSTAVVSSEIIKTASSFAILLYHSVINNHAEDELYTVTISTAKIRELLLEIYDEIMQLGTIIPLMIPAILYTIQNNLQYLAATNLDAATFSVLYQGKILTTAFFATVLLRQRLTGGHWVGLILLTCGIILISISTGLESAKSASGSLTGQVTGLFAVLCACIISGFAGTFVEFLLKQAKNAPSASHISQLWARNVQLSAGATVVACGMAAFMDGKQIVRDGFFFGYNYLVWTTILLQAVGGLIVSVVVAYADNISKGFATSLSLVASTSISIAMGDCILTRGFVLGVLMVLGATNIYVLSQEWEHRRRRVYAFAYGDAFEKSDRHDTRTDVDSEGSFSDDGNDEKRPMLRDETNRAC